MGHRHPLLVQAEVALTLVVPGGTSLAVTASLHYRPADPYAVHVVFHEQPDTLPDPADHAIVTDHGVDGEQDDPGRPGPDDAGAPITPSEISWSFARSLLVDGLLEPAGLGDVRVWPWRTGAGPAIALALSSPDGQALFELPRGTLEEFLHSTFAVVPCGTESDHLDVDLAVSVLLSRVDD